MTAGVRAYLLLTLLCALLYLPALSLLPTTDRDEARYVQATKQMIETGDYIDMRFQKQAYHKKPVGIQWLQVAAVKVWGGIEAADMAAYRAPSVLGAWGAVLLTFLIGSILFDRRVALLGAAMLACSLLMIAQARLATTDAMLLLAVTGAIAVLARQFMAHRKAQETGNAAALPLWAALAFWVALAGGILLKGPIAPFVVILTVIALSIADRSVRWLRGLRVLIGVPVMLALVLPWFIAIMLVTDGEFFASSVGVDFFRKIVSAQESHGAPPGYFAVILLVAFWPASLYVWPSFVEAVRTRAASGVRFCLAWLIPSWLIFEVVPTKLPHYTLPLYPALALLTAAAVLKLAEERRTSFEARWVKALIVLWAIPAIALAVGAVILPIKFGDGFSALSLLPLAAGLAAALFTVVLAWRGDVLRATLSGLALGSVALVTILYGVVPRLTTVWLSKEIAAAVNATVPDRSIPVAIAGYHEPSVVFLLGTDTVLTHAAGAARHLSEHCAKTNAIAIVDFRNTEKFKATLADLGVEAETLSEVRGINYSNGREMKMTLYRAAC